MTELKCWNCGAGLNDIPRPISRHANCPACFNELHCCRLCVHYDPSIAAGQCIEERADPPVIKEGANFCDWFRPDPQAYNADVTRKSQGALTRLDALFGGEQDPSADTEPDAPSASEAGAIDNPESKPLTRQDEAKAQLDKLFSAPDPGPETGKKGGTPD